MLGDVRWRFLAWGADAVGVQDVVSPDGLARGRVQHGPHHLVKRLVGVAPQCALGVLIDQAPAEPCRHTPRSQAAEPGGDSNRD